MRDVLSTLERMLPLLISLLSVCVAAAAVLASRRNAYRQAVFARKADAYEEFFAAVAVYAHEPQNPEKRAALTRAFYHAVLYCPVKDARMINLFANLALSQPPEDIPTLDEITPDLLQLFRADLRKTWSGNPLDTASILDENSSRQDGS